MSNFEFIKELNITSDSVQKCILELYEHCTLAEENYGGNVTLFVSHINQATENAVTCFYQISHKKAPDGLTRCLAQKDQVISCAGKEAYGQIEYIAKNAIVGKKYNREQQKRLLEELLSLVRNLYMKLGGRGTTRPFDEKKLERMATGASSSKAKEFNFEGTMQAAFTNVVRQYKDGKDYITKQNDNFAKSFSELKAGLASVVQLINEKSEAFVSKEELFSTIRDVTGNLRNEVDLGNREMTRRITELEHSIKSININPPDSNAEILNDISAKIAVLFEKIDRLESEEKVRSQETERKFEKMEKTLHQFSETNKKNWERQAATNKTNFEDLAKRLDCATEQCSKTIKNYVSETQKIITETIKDTIKESIRTEFKEKEPVVHNKKPTFSKPTKNASQGNQGNGFVMPSITLPKTMDSVLKYRIDNKNSFCLGINVLWVSMLILWVLDSFFLNTEDNIDSLILIKAAALSWYFITWSIAFIGTVIFYIIVARVCLSIVYRLSKSVKMDKRYFKKVLWWMIFGIAVLLLGKYIHNSFFEVAHFNINWKEILMASYDDQIMNGIRGVFLYWKGLR